jgi:hypothetical protein
MKVREIIYSSGSPMLRVSNPKEEVLLLSSLIGVVLIIVMSLIIK